MSDVLENKVDDKYYISQKAIDGILEHTKRNKENGNGFGAKFRDKDEISDALTSTYYKNWHSPILKEIVRGSQAHRIYDSEGLSKTIVGSAGGGGAKTGYYTVPKIDCLIEGKHKTDNVYNPEAISPTLLGTDYKNPVKIVEPKIRKVLDATSQHYTVVDSDGIAPTMSACDYKDPQKITVPCLTPTRQNKRQNGRRFKENEDPMFTLTGQDIHGVLLYNGKEYNIRRLTPKECFRLQGFTDEQFEKARAVNSDTQLYKQAGNAVTVNVAYEFGKYILEKDKEK